jgi:hypothetical protein
MVLNYDPNSLKVAKLGSEAEARHQEAWAGAKRWYELGFCYIILL